MSEGVGLADAIAALRDELLKAWVDGEAKRLRFKPSAVELTLQVAVTSTGSGKAGIKWWLVEAGGEYSKQSAVTQTMRLTLEPVLVDAQGQVLELLVSDTAETAGSGETSLSDPA